MGRRLPSGRVWRRAVLALASAGIAAAGCAGCGGSSRRPALPTTGCQAPIQEQLDSRSTQHLFPGAPQPSYLTNPPTSGPHQLGEPPTGVVTTPIPRPRQVAMLESGFIIVQYQALSAADVARLATLAGTLVTVAPPAAPLPADVVATAWTWKQQCGPPGPATLAALQAFIAAHRGKGFSHT